MTTFTLSRLSTPIGPMLISPLTTTSACACSIGKTTKSERMQTLLRRQYDEVIELREGDAPVAVADKLSAYFAGDVAAIGKIATESGGTPFQRSVWKALRDIPAGVTWTYSELAKHIGRPAAVRAVGLANVRQSHRHSRAPCHRVIGANGSTSPAMARRPRAQDRGEHTRGSRKVDATCGVLHERAAFLHWRVSRDVSRRVLRVRLCRCSGHNRGRSRASSKLLSFGVSVSRRPISISRVRSAAHI